MELKNEIVVMLAKLKISIVCIFLLISFFVSAQSIKGGWLWEGTDEEGKEILASVIFMNGYQVATWYTKDKGEFITTNGGKYTYSDGLLTEVVEFHYDKPETVGDTARLEMEFKSPDEIFFKESGSTLKRIDDGTPGQLSGPWLISGRKRNGEIRQRDTSRPRKTMKILSGTRFQWIAYNTETAEFFGTGGGTYTTIDGKYTENIEFFSRDNSRVGAELEFDFDLVDGKWHHSGNNSRGEPMFEIWSKRE